ncbi:MAG TPA: hypothetical protein VLB50_07575 [Ignavibacteriaceae bacterium]|nr:hypothetical protein [Ignavibacteriaceae bacterium]
MSSEISNSLIEDLVNSINRIESRLSEVERALNLKRDTVETAETAPLQHKNEEEDDSLELAIGEFWFAKIGILAFLLGMFFLLTQPLNDYPPLLPVAVGYILSFALIFIPGFWLKSSRYISGFLIGGGAALLYLTTLRFHFFGTAPIITSRFPVVILLLGVSSLTTLIAFKRHSVYLIALAEMFFIMTALVTEIPLLIFLMLTLISLSIVQLSIKYTSSNLMVFGVIATCVAHCLWFVNNPLLGYTLQITTEFQYNLIFILIYILIYGTGSLRLIKDKKLELDELFITIMNASLGYGLFLLISVLSGVKYLGIIHLGAFVVFMLLAILFWTKLKSRFGSFIYAMSAYAALSTSIIASNSEPSFYVLLCWQSIIVITTALWFRSKFIIVANVFIFGAILISYLLNVKTVGIEGISFGLAALISARVLNWQKERLELTTDYIRMAYLIMAFFVLPYVLYQVLPSSFVGLSWAGLALLYYLMSRLLENKKYRMMAVFTLILTVLYLVAFGITSTDITYKIISFLAVSIILLVISVMYTKMRTRTKIKGIS